MKKTVYLVRPGQSVDEAEGWLPGGGDHPLTELGEQQMHDLGLRLHTTPVEMMYASPLARAVDAAHILSGYVHAPVETHPDLREWNREGMLTGLSRQQSEHMYPEEMKKLEYYRSHALQGEVYTDFVQRVLSAFSEILERPYRRLVVVTHPRVIGVWLREFHFLFHHPTSIDRPDHIIELRLNRNFRIENMRAKQFADWGM